MAPPGLTRDIRLRAFAKAKPERAYSALTSARELCLWWLDQAETDARNMGRFSMVWPSSSAGRTGAAEGVFVDLEEGRKVAWIWKPKSIPNGIPTLVSFFIEKKGRGCDVTVVHAGFSCAASADRRYARCREGWEDCLAKLKLYLESGRTRKRDRISLSDVGLPARARPRQAVGA